jgi:hypothetical protein
MRTILSESLVFFGYFSISSEASSLGSGGIDKCIFIQDGQQCGFEVHAIRLVHNGALCSVIIR